MPVVRISDDAARRLQAIHKTPGVALAKVLDVAEAVPPTDAELKSYVAHCPSCGGRIVWAKRDPFKHRDVTCFDGQCGNRTCARKWSFLAEVDASGTFGVMGFQCDNEDRIMQ